MILKNFKKNDKKSMTMEELVEKFKDNNFMVVTYKPNGDIEVFVGSSKKEEE